MVLIVGLGNPGKKFEKTRHNIGFRVVEELAKGKGFSDFRLEKKFKALVSEGTFDNNKVILALPETFMNESGKAVKLLTKPYNLNPNNLIIVHDDIDLSLGKIKISIARGAAGHKGVESIIRELKTKDFIRFRIGIKSQKIENGRQKIEAFVLQKFTKEEEKIVKEVIEKTVEAIKIVIKEGAEKAMNKYN